MNKAVRELIVMSIFTILSCSACGMSDMDRYALIGSLNQLSANGTALSIANTPQQVYYTGTVTCFGCGQ